MTTTGKPRRRKGQHYSIEVKREALRLVREGHSKTSIARKLRLTHPSVVTTWIAKSKLLENGLSEEVELFRLRQQCKALKSVIRTLLSDA